MMRLIDADAYKAEMKQRQDACAEWQDEAKACCDTELFARADGSLSAFIEAKLTLDKMPTIDAVPVVHGAWVWDDARYDCSECGHHAYGNSLEIISGKYHYCPNCGAKMDGGDPDAAD